MPAPIYPPLLAKGDVIGVVAPASPPAQPDIIDEAISRLEAHGFRVKPGRFLRKRDGYLAGSDKERAADLNAFFADKEIKAIFCLRGGYGSCRILPLVDYAMVRANPKPLLGYSDITALQLGIFKKTGLVTFHGPNASSAFEPANIATCESMLMRRDDRGNKQAPLIFSRSRVRTLVPGQARGRLLGGNFTCLLRLLGTPFQPDFRGAILFLEDTAERAYRIDGMFTHLRLAGVLGQINGLVLGQFDYEADTKEPERIRLTLRREAKNLNLPCVEQAPIGHFAGQTIVPQGVEAELDATARKLTFRFPEFR